MKKPRKPKVHIRLPRKHKGRKNKLPQFVPTLNAGVIPQGPMLDSLIDVTLGMMFCQALRKTGLRKELIRFLCVDREQKEQKEGTTGADTE